MTHNGTILCIDYGEVRGMSAKRRFQISVHQTFLCSLLILVGILIGSIFVRISDQTVLAQFANHHLAFFDAMDLSDFISIFLKELLVLALMTAFSYLPYGQLAALVLLFYKGFCIGIVSAVLCWRFSIAGVKYILLLVLPQNLMYLSALLLAAQITFQRPHRAELSKHTKTYYDYKHTYWICYTLLMLGVLFEVLVGPWIYQFLF